MTTFCGTDFIQDEHDKKLRIFSSSGNFPAISDDLVNSYHLLLSCLDLFYSNAMTTRHAKEMVKPEFIEGKNID